MGETKSVDISQQNRRLQVLEAAWQVIVRDGLDRTSLRAIAQYMGCTTGVVTHYFRNKQELILFALHQVTQRLETGIEEVLKTAVGSDRIVTMLSVFLPVNQESEDILKVWIAFLGYAVGRNDLMEEHQKSSGRLRDLIINELKELQDNQVLRKDADINQEANALLALVNGLSIDSLIQKQKLNRDQQIDIIKSYFQPKLLN